MATRANGTAAAHGVQVVSAMIRRNVIRDRLEALGMTQRECARRMGVSYRDANRKINGEAEPSLLQAIVFSVVLGVPIEQLFDVAIKTKPA